MDAPLPDVFESVLDAAALDALFRDLAALSSPLEISVKQAATRHAEPACAIDLAAARAALTSAQVRAVQIRYIHEGKRWCDTLINAASGVRIIRIAG